MKSVKTIAAVGLADPVRAELEALIERCTPRLQHTWRWGSEQSPDALLLDPTDPAGRMAKTRAIVTGVRFVTVIDYDDPEPEGLYLRRPFRSQALVDMLDAAATATVTGSELSYQNDEDYFSQIDRFDPEAQVEARPPEGAAALAPRVDDDAAHGGLDEMIKGDPLAEPPPKPKLIQPDTTFEGRRGAPDTARAEIRRSEAFGRIGDPQHDDPPVEGIPMPGYQPTPPPSAPATADGAEGSSQPPGHALAEFLDGGMLRGPSRIALDDAPALSVDPKLRLFHASGDLAALAPYCERGLPAASWKALTSAELQQVRAGEPPRPYAELLWLAALLRSDGRLASRLDPGGSYAIRRRVAIDAGFRGHGPIADALARPVRLHEAAQASGRSMAEVFDVVNAYDAIGQLDWSPRAPRHVAAEPASERRKGLLGGLRWPFGKR